MSIVAAVSALFQAVLWLLAAGLQSVRDGPTRRARPLRGGHAVRRTLPVSQPHDPGQDQFRPVLTEALAPGRLAAYARVVLTDECQGRLRMAEGSDQVSRWMRPSCYEAQEGIGRLLQAWVVRACPESQDLASFSHRIVSEPAWQKHCTLPELLLLPDVAAIVLYRTWCGPVDYCTTASGSWPRFPTCLPGGTCLTTSKPDVAAPPGCSGWL